MGRKRTLAHGARRCYSQRRPAIVESATAAAPRGRRQANHRIGLSRRLRNRRWRRGSARLEGHYEQEATPTLARPRRGSTGPNRKGRSRRAPARAGRPPRDNNRTRPEGRDGAGNGGARQIAGGRSRAVSPRRSRRSVGAEPDVLKSGSTSRERDRRVEPLVEPRHACAWCRDRYADRVQRGKRRARHHR